MRIFSGIQPTGRKHLGNYIGAIEPYVHHQGQGEAIYCIVDLHATTVPYEPAELRERLYDTAALLLAAGLHPERCIFFRQGDVLEHSELAWLLSSVTAFGDLNRMHQFKEKAGAQRDLVSAGLFTYPILMAADVLAYRADEVPVGDDQRQHIELMRDVAERFNARFGETLVVPTGVYREVGARIMDLQEPERKMSTTGGTEQGTVLVLDDPATIERKLKRAVTDSGSEIRRAPDKPGISNLIEILAAVQGTSFEQVEAEHADSRYGDFKLAVAQAVIEHLRPVQRALRRAARRRAGARAGPRRGGREGPRDRRAGARRRAPRDGRRARAASVSAVRAADLELDLDVFAGPFDLLLTLVLREEVDLLEVDLADVVITYIDQLEQRGELDLEAATEFLVLIAALLELKSRLMLPGEEEELLDLEPGEAAEELLARLLEAHRYRGAGGLPDGACWSEQSGHRFRSAPAAAVAAPHDAAGGRRRLRPGAARQGARRAAADAAGDRACATSRSRR